jgi:hypothetical protein
MRVVIASAAASQLLVLTLFKQGSYLNVLVVVEPPLLVLAACGWAWLLERRSLGALAACGLALLLGIAQTVSLVTSPLDPSLFGRPRAASPPAWKLDDSGVDRAVAAAGACPVGTSYSGVPFVAFAARRTLPGDQPDQFIIHSAATNARFLAAANRDAARCP